MFCHISKIEINSFNSLPICSLWNSFEYISYSKLFLASQRVCYWHIRYILVFDTLYWKISTCFWWPFCFGNVIISSEWCDRFNHILSCHSRYGIKQWKETLLCNAFSPCWLNPYSKCSLIAKISITGTTRRGGPRKVIIIFIDSYWK